MRTHLQCDRNLSEIVHWAEAHWIGTLIKKCQCDCQMSKVLFTWNSVLLARQCVVQMYVKATVLYVKLFSCDSKLRENSTARLYLWVCCMKVCQRDEGSRHVSIVTIKVCFARISAVLCNIVFASRLFLYSFSLNSCWHFAINPNWDIASI